MEPEPDARQRYNDHFNRLDADSSGRVTLAAARPLCRRAGVDDAQIERIWTVVDGTRSGSLDRDGFAHFMHLVTLLLQGHPLPAGTDAVWELSEEDIVRYDGFFGMLDASGSGSVSRSQAEPLFDRSELPAYDVSLIWTLADVDADGRLSLMEFRVAMHLATLAVQGQPLPSILPPVLELAARAPRTSPAASTRPPRPSLAFGAAPARAGGVVPPISPSALAHYRAVFLAAEPERGGGLNGEVGARVLAQSGLPDDDLAHIWELADLDADGEMHCMYACMRDHICGVGLILRPRA